MPWADVLYSAHGPPIGFPRPRAAALLFGASTPLAKFLVGSTPPLLLAGLLYLGSGLGLGLLLMLRGMHDPDAVRQMRIPLAEVPWLLGAIFFAESSGRRC